MNLKTLKVYHYFWIATFLFLVTGFLIFNQDDVSIVNIGDTYYVMALSHLSILLSISYFILGTGYWLVLQLFKRQLIKILTLFHCIIMFGWILVFGCVYFYDKVNISEPFPLFDYLQLINQTSILLIIAVIFVAQPLYLINLSSSIFRKRALKTH